jgi:hypothetical protein
VISNEQGEVFITFRLYDARGRLVASSNGLKSATRGVSVHCSDGELLLEVPKKADAPIRYRLYNREGLLLTSSDGERTKIYGLLRMEAGKA